MIILAITCTSKEMEMKFLFINLIPNSRNLREVTDQADAQNKLWLFS